MSWGFYIKFKVDITNYIIYYAATWCAKRTFNARLFIILNRFSISLQVMQHFDISIRRA